MIDCWNKIEDGLPVIKSKGAKVKVRLSDQTELFAYFYPDKCQWIENYGKKPSYFWNCSTKEPLFNVTHWRTLKEP